MNRHEIYRPMVQRTLETYQVQHLARCYDFGRQSRVASLLVREINERMERAEADLGILRVYPFELYLKRNGQGVALPLFRPEYLEPMLAGATFARAREKVAQTCWERYRDRIPGARPEDLHSAIDPWSRVCKRGPSRYRDQLSAPYGPGSPPGGQEWSDFVAGLNPETPLQRLEQPDLMAPREVVTELEALVRAEAGLGPRLARQLVEDVITLRHVCCPRASALESGEMPLLLTHAGARLSAETDTRFRRLAPVIVRVLTPGEEKHLPPDVPGFIASLKERLVRVCFEAYAQDGLFTQLELEWVFQVSSARISELLRTVQHQHQLVVPTPGTVLDAGRSVTHKHLIVSLHLQGHSVMEIARKTHHSPRAVDNYIGSFEAVLILNLYGMPPPLMARILKRGMGLVHEYLALIDEFYRERREMREYLLARGVNF